MKTTISKGVNLTRLRKAFKGCKLISSCINDKAVTIIKVKVNTGVIVTFKINPIDEIDENTRKLVMYLHNLPREYEEINI